MAAKTQQALQLQVSQLQVSPRLPLFKTTYSWVIFILPTIFHVTLDHLNNWKEKYILVQAEKERLQEDFSKLTREKELIELRLKAYEAESTQLAPTLEETQWEVSHGLYMWYTVS